MTTEKSKKTPDKRRKYDDAFKAEALRLAAESRSTQAAAQQLGISSKLLYRWQEAKLVAEVGSVEVARDPEVRQLRAQLKRAEQELDILKKALVIFGQPTRCAPFVTSPSAKRRCPYASFARRCACRLARTVRGSAASCLPPSQPGK